MKLSRLKGRKINARVLKQGQVFKGKTFLVRYLAGAPKRPDCDPTKPALYVGTMASLKLHKHAVKRNRMRRRCREALRKYVLDKNGLGPVQILLSPRIKSLDCEYKEIVEDVEKFIQEIAN